jgi:hypothetical protein
MAFVPDLEQHCPRNYFLPKNRILAVKARRSKLLNVKN